MKKSLFIAATILVVVIFFCFEFFSKTKLPVKLDKHYQKGKIFSEDGKWALAAQQFEKNLLQEIAKKDSEIQELRSQTKKPSDTKGAMDNVAVEKLQESYTQQSKMIKKLQETINQKEEKLKDLQNQIQKNNAQQSLAGNQ